MTTRRLAGLLVATAALALTGCSSESPGPDGLTTPQREFVSEVTPLDEHVAAEPGAALRLGEDICARLEGGASVEEVAVASQRFTGGEVFLSRDEATAVVDAARRHLCG